jgi:hypothetical protein|tara:strand:+ start:277 stop:537 length:261 start_codon:yes stop_codon:yes gene_type:complete
MMHLLPRRVQYLLLLTLSLWCLQGLLRLLFWRLISNLPVTAKYYFKKSFASLEQFSVVHLLDHIIGNMLSLFKRTKLYDNTIFVIF